MHILTIQTKFTFGDVVRFDAPRPETPGQPSTGSGKIMGIMVDEWRTVSYMIALAPFDQGYEEAVAGIFESEITLLKPDGD